MGVKSDHLLLWLPSGLCYFVGLCLCCGFPFYLCLVAEGVMFNSVQFCTVLFVLGGMILIYNGRD